MTESYQELQSDRDRLHNIYIKQTRTIHELQDEIARLKEIDKNTSDRVRATYSIKEKVLDIEKCPIHGIDAIGVNINVPCSAELDMDMANESI